MSRNSYRFSEGDDQLLIRNRPTSTPARIPIPRKIQESQDNVQENQDNVGGDEVDCFHMPN
jgi:hypothetical protein